MKYSKTFIMFSITRMALPLLLAVGTFMGVPNDPQLTGFFWLLVLLWTASDVFGVFTVAKDESHSKPDIFTFADKVDADEVLYELRDKLDEKGQASVKDLYEIANYKESGSDKYGWVDLKNACVRFVQDDGWMLYLPKPVVLK